MSFSEKKLEKILVANRGEIAVRIFRAATELKIRTVAVYSFEDRYSLHRYKADEAYQIGREDDPLKPYLDIDEIVEIAKLHNVDAIHPGYGFLAENAEFAKRCQAEGILFIGPRPDVMEKLGGKISAKKIAIQADVPIIEDSKVSLTDLNVASEEAQRLGLPVIIKASAGGGGRGMRVVRSLEELQQSFPAAKREALNAFGDDTVFFEKFIDDPKHVEVQIVGDNYGNIVHLFERDCSVQRRFQKIVELAPCPNLSQPAKQKLYDYAVRIAKEVQYNNVGTVEFLVDGKENIYFIEVNPRIQVEHTVTEEITGIDIVRTQILIAKGLPLSHPQIDIKGQEQLSYNGFAIQCRITSEDPANNFKPDYGRIVAFRSPGGFGIRLDGGNAYTGAVVSPYFDSLLVKVIASGRTLQAATERLGRALQEFRIRGVKTNIPFLDNVISHPLFLEGRATVKFIDSHPELLRFARARDRASKVLNYLAEVCVNGNSDVKSVNPNKKFRPAIVPEYRKYTPYPEGSRDRYQRLGREAFLDWLSKEKAIQFTDTTMRDAHQSLLATRVRTIDMLKVAESFARQHAQIFSMEVWGGATFDVSLRFLRECPWERLKLLREAVPNILFQMLLRGSNSVGYTAYPDNLIQRFIEEAATAGIDIFRIFDSMNWLEAMRPSIKTVRERTDSIAEVCICYTGDILDPARKKFTLQYYLDLARQIEDTGAHILGIKDMAGLLKPYAAEVLITELKKVIKIPIHLHTHDTAGVQSATYLKAIEAGVNVVDVALASMSGLTSQPNFNSIVAMLKGHERENPFDLDSLNRFSDYWESVREFYYPFESELKGGTAEVYEHEIPGGQYSNLRPQARGLGLEEKFETIKKNYIAVNKLLGDVVKVTPSSKVVGDMALFMTANNLTAQDVLTQGDKLAFPESLKSMLRGDLGQPYGGFPEALQKMVLKSEKPITTRPNERLKPIEFHEEFEAFRKDFDESVTFLDFISYKLYPKVFEDYYAHLQNFWRVMYVPTPAFFYGMKPNEEILVEIADGKTLIIKLQYISEPDEDGVRTVFFKLNGQTRGIEVKDRSLKSTKVAHRKAQKENEIGSPLQGKLSKILVKEGASVTKDTALFVIEAMKMESIISARNAGKVSKIYLSEGTLVQTDDLVLELDGATPNAA